jgi:gas vesicle protein
MDDRKKVQSISSGWYILGGVVVGAVAGLLLAPKKGSETREDIGDWGRRSQEKTRAMISRIGKSLPTRVKAAAVFGAAKDGANEAFDEARDKAKHFVGS